MSIWLSGQFCKIQFFLNLIQPLLNDHEIKDHPFVLSDCISAYTVHWYGALFDPDSPTASRSVNDSDCPLSSRHEFAHHGGHVFQEKPRNMPLRGISIFYQALYSWHDKKRSHIGCAEVLAFTSNAYYFIYNTTIILTDQWFELYKTNLTPYDLLSRWLSGLAATHGRTKPSLMLHRRTWPHLFSSQEI